MTTKYKSRSWRLEQEVDRETGRLMFYVCFKVNGKLVCRVQLTEEQYNQIKG